MILDTKSMLILYLIVNIINTGAMAVIWGQNRKRFAGITFWMAGLALQSVGPLLLLLRGTVPDLVSMTLANTIILAGVLVILIGLERFTGKKGRQIHNYILLFVIAAVSAYYVVVEPNLVARDIAVTTGLLIYSVQCSWLLLRRTDAGMRQRTFLAGIICAIFAAFNLAKIILTITVPQRGSDFFSSEPVTAIAITGYILIIISLTISLILMVNRRFLDDIQIQEEKFTAAFHSSPYAITITRPSDGKMIEINDGFERITGYQYDEVIGKSTIDLHLWARDEDRQAVVNELTQGRKVNTAEYEFRKKNGELMTGLFSADLITTGGQTYILSSISDVTESRRTADALRDSEEHYRLLAANSQDVIWTLDPQFRFTYVSPSVYKLRGVTPEEAINEDFASTLTLDSLQKIQNLIEEGLPDIDKGVSRKARLDIEQYRKDGSTVWVEIAVQTMQDSEGAFTGFVGISRDITERRQSEALLRQSEERYRTISRLSSEFAYSCIHKGSDGYSVDWITNAFYTLTGYTEAELRERGCWLFVSHPDDQEAAEGALQGLQAGESATQEFRIVSKAGRILDVINYMECHDDPNTPGGLRLFGAVQDITDRKRLDEEKQRVEKLESVGLLAGGIAHDFNNILTAILGNISLASMEAAPGSDLRNSLEQAEKASLRAKDLTVQLLTFSRGGSPVKKLGPLTDLIKDTASFALRGSSVNCQFSIPADLWHAEIDAGQVSQIIHNLAVNAKQAMPTGGTIEISAENIELRKTQELGKGLPLKEGNYVRIAVADHGTGIPKGHLEKIFDPFFSTKQEGSGLGLATSFSIARQHGGHLSVESELGSGSTFYLYLPASMKTVTQKQDRKAAIKPADSARILVMDDEEGIRGIAGRLLQHIGYKDIEFAANGTEAIKLYKAAMETGRPFDVAILDLTIPGGMGGEETIRKLIEIDPGVKAIVSSGYIDDAVIARYREYGFSGMVAKPYTIEQLRKAVQHVIV